MKFKTQTQKYRMKSEAMDNGADAYCNGKTIESNPYPKTHPSHQYWLDGYNREQYLQESE